MNKNTAIKNLKAGDRFMLPEHSTVYTCVSAVTVLPFTTVVYSLPGLPNSTFYRRALATVILVD